LEQNIGEIQSITDLLAEGITPEDLLYRLLGENTQILEKRETKFYCHCSRRKTEEMLISLGKEEIESIIREQGEAEVVCHFCNDKYHFSRLELERIKAKL
jgi:molecular chaperone Hsp33